MAFIFQQDGSAVKCHPLFPMMMDEPVGSGSIEEIS